MARLGTLRAGGALLLCFAASCGSKEAALGGSGAGASGANALASGGGASGAASGSAGASSPAQAGAASSSAAGLASDIDCRTNGDGKSTITLINHCSAPLSFSGSKIEGGELAPGAHACRDVGSATESIPAIRYWGFIGEDPGGEKYTLAELTLNTDFNDFDWYDISHVDAHNLPMQIRPVGMPSCRVLTCAQSLLANCPPEGQFVDASGKVVSCVSPDRNDPNSPVARYFEASCKDAYSWSGDDADSVAACAGEDYDVEFCP